MALVTDYITAGGLRFWEVLVADNDWAGLVKVGNRINYYTGNNPYPEKQIQSKGPSDVRDFRITQGTAQESASNGLAVTFCRGNPVWRDTVPYVMTAVMSDTRLAPANQLALQTIAVIRAAGTTMGLDNCIGRGPITYSSTVENNELTGGTQRRVLRLSTSLTFEFKT